MKPIMKGFDNKKGSRKFWPMRLWEGMGPIMGGYKVPATFPGPGHRGQPLGNRGTLLDHLGVVVFRIVQLDIIFLMTGW